MELNESWFFHHRNYCEIHQITYNLQPPIDKRQYRESDEKLVGKRYYSALDMSVLGEFSTIRPHIGLFSEKIAKIIIPVVVIVSPLTPYVRLNNYQN